MPIVLQNWLCSLSQLRDGLRSASEVPLSPSGEAELADEEMSPEEVEAVERRFQELLASGRLSQEMLDKAFDRHFTPKAAPGPLVTAPTAAERPGAEAVHLHEVQPEASRLEQEEAGRGLPLPPGQGPAAVEGLPPASLCDQVIPFLGGALRGEAEDAFEDHLATCTACKRTADDWAQAEAAREAPDGRP
jgi:hypothetical protein